MKKPKTIFSLDTLFKMCCEIKGSGKTIGLTHGAFDLFHYSHLDLLHKSSALCDFLIVGVDSDKSVASYKESKRPIVKEEYRLGIINGIDVVDAVFMKDIPLDDNRHIDLYKDLMVDVITVGQHYFAEELMYERADRSKAKLVKLNTWQEPTTTSIINTIIEQYSGENTREVPKSNY
ncbi:adenylyltransferase/cytidyltransferase family protein [Patescibacteria group bacterium]